MALLPLVVRAAGGPISPRPINDAERAAVALAVAYFENGPQAWLERLAASAPLARLAPDHARAEIAVRLGARRDSVWRLRTPGPFSPPGSAVFAVELPSGLDEILHLELVREDGDWRILRLRILGDPAPIRQRGSGNAVSSRSADALGDRDLPRLAPLSATREALGEAGDRVRSDPGSNSATGFAEMVGQLWEAQYLLAQRRLNEAETILGRPTSSPSTPLRSLLLARLAHLRGDHDETVLAYDQAERHVVDHDGVLLEAARALAELGLLAEADARYQELVRRRSRRSEAYYLAAIFTAQRARFDRAESYFRAGWQLRPLERTSLFASPGLASLAVREKLIDLLEIDSAREPIVSLSGPRRPLGALQSRAIRLLGSELTVEIGGGRIVVPGGFELAPSDTPLESAATAARREEMRALEAVERLRDQAASASFRPSARRKIATAATALARQQRWSEVVTLTDLLAGTRFEAPPEILRLRARALMEAGRHAEAQRLLVELAQADLVHQRPDPVTYYQLSELVAALGEHDLAIRLLRRAQRLSLHFGVDNRIRRLEMEKELVSSYDEYRTEHFVIRYPAITGERYPQEMGMVLEEELKRLERFVPLASPQPIHVDLFPLEAFMESYSQGVMVLGLYDGRMRIPFADLKSLHHFLVSILSHELIHAMVAQHTDDRAPKWLHEGLAEHAQMVQSSINPFPDLAAEGRALSFALLDPVLAGFSHQQLVSLAYNQAAWALHFIEARFGVAGVHRLLAAFAAGHDTEEALRKGLGMTLREFERDAWHWATHEAPATWPTEIRRYDKELGPYLRRSSVAASLPPPPPPIARLGRREKTPAPAPAPDPLLEPMQAWGAPYSERSVPVKAALAPVIQAFRFGQVPADLPAACQRLEARVTEALQHETALRPPDTAAGQPLRAAYRHLLDLARACRAGQDSRVRAELGKAEAELGRAARAMKKYELSP